MAVLIVIVLLALLVILSGCVTSYNIQACHPDGGVCTTVDVKSYREFEQPNVVYSRDGDSVTFSFGATSATTAASPIESAVADVIRATPSVILPVPE